MRVQILRVSDHGSKPCCGATIAKDQYNKNIWLMDFDTLEQLMGFVDKNGSIILSKGKKYPLLRIYDDYVE